MQLAESFISSSLGSNFQWVQVRNKKDKRSYTEVTRASPPLTCANRIPIGFSSKSHNLPFQPPLRKSVFSRLNSEDLCRNLASSDQDSFLAENTTIQHPNLNLDLNIGRNFSSTNSAQISAHKNSLDLPPYSRCLSHKHARPNCWNRVRCTTCFRLGHIANHCRFPPVFRAYARQHPCLPSVRHRKVERRTTGFLKSH